MYHLQVIVLYMVKVYYLCNLVRGAPCLANVLHEKK
jgi:hypothetical protein